MSTRRWRKGFTITEMLVVIGLMGVAALLSARLFTGSMRAIGNSSQAQKQVSQFEHLTQALERDVWNAMSIAAGEGQTVTLEQADGSGVSWTFGETEVIRAASNSPSEQRWQMALPLTGRRDGAWLVLESPSPRARLERRFVSQMISARPL